MEPLLWYERKCTVCIPFTQSLVEWVTEEFNIISRLELSRASESELENLARACDPATFGVNQEDVLDESYRKAGKLDVANFATKFKLEKSGIMDAVCAALLEGHDSNRHVEAELYKLNVYGERIKICFWLYNRLSSLHSLGKGAFFKSHKDTPRSPAMFGSLVVVFPTKHEGGALKLRHDNNEWIFDSATTAAQHHPNPLISYIAFYSDVEHEVTPVTSGHRVSLTWNLYFSTKPNNSPRRLIRADASETELTLKDAFTRVLSDSTFLPEGGLLGFGLRQEYPLNAEDGLGNLIECLKGGDAIIQSVCRQLSLQTSLRVIYRDERYEEFVMVDDLVDFKHYGEVYSLNEALGERKGGRRIHVTGPVLDQLTQPQESEFDEEDPKVTWVTDLTDFTRAKAAYVAYGNEANLRYTYGNVCLIVNVGPPDDRTASIPEPIKKKPRYY